MKKKDFDTLLLVLSLLLLIVGAPAACVGGEVTGAIVVGIIGGCTLIFGLYTGRIRFRGR